MINIITAGSKYIFILLGALFVLSGFLGHVFYEKRKREGRVRKGTLQKAIIFIIVILGNIVLYINKEDFIFILFLFMELLYFFFVLNVFPMIYKRCNRILLNDMGFLMCIGFLVLSRLSTDKLIRQYLLVVAGTIVMFLVPVVVEKLHFIIKLHMLYCFIGIGLLGLVLILGNTVYGANLSINIGSISIQPSEFVKLSYVVFIASMLYKNQSLRKIIITSVLAAVHVLILIASNDLGTGLIFYITYIIMLFDATHQKRYLALGGGAALLAGVAAYFVIYHVRSRVVVWIDPFAYIDTKGYQVVQSIYAIGNGGFFGTGLTRGLPGSIPVVTKDFIFSAICEELGGLFGIIIILVCLNLFYEIITILSESNDKFNRLMLGGFGIMFVFQSFLNIGGVINCIPSTGVTLPFVSYGGSSCISMMIMLAMIQGISAKNYKLNQINQENGEEEPEHFQIRSPRMVIGGLALVVILIVSFTHMIFTFDKALLNSTYNKRLGKMEAQVVRGSILSTDGEVLAYTELDEKGSQIRKYPLGSLFAHVVGYVAGENAGLEGVLDYLLLQSDESLDNKLLADLTGKRYNGNDITTTLNVQLQQAVDVALGDRKGAVVVMGTDGSILAMVSKPDFEPETLTLNGEDAPLLNRAVQGLYIPGSTFKLVTLLEYYRECRDSDRLNVFNEYAYECAGEFAIGDKVIKCVGHTAHGNVDTYDSMAYSCNGSFINIGLKLDFDNFAATAEQLLFNNDVHYHDSLGLITSQSQFILTDTSSDWLIAQTSFGQGETLITPLQNALLVQAIANKGALYEPYLIKSITSADGKSVYEYNGENGNAYYGNILTEDEAIMLSQHLKQVIDVGFPHVFSEAPYNAAGKSGTSQYGTQGLEHSLFVGYMPYNNPKIIVSVVLESFNQSGTPDKYAVDVAKEIFDAYYEIYGVD